MTELAFDKITNKINYFLNQENYNSDMFKYRNNLIDYDYSKNDYVKEIYTDDEQLELSYDYHISEKFTYWKKDLSKIKYFEAIEYSHELVDLPNIEVLVLMRGSRHGRYYKKEDEEIQNKFIDFNFKEKYPNLKILQTNYNINIESLPESLETLILESSGIDIDLSKKINFPKNLKNLKIKYCQNFNNENIPKNLEYLDIHFNFQPRCSYNISNMPENLIGLSLYGYIEFESFKNLPNKLRYFSVNNVKYTSTYRCDNLFDRDKKIFDFNVNNYDIVYLPESIEVLVLEGFRCNLINSISDNLKVLYNNTPYFPIKYPSNLETLISYNNTIDKSLYNNLPVSLKNLYVKSSESKDTYLMLNPVGEIKNINLEYLIELENINIRLDRSMRCKISLPKKLKNIEIEGCKIDNMNFVNDKLHKMSIENDDFDFQLNNLPENMEEISIHSRIFNQKLDELPINLKKLIIKSHEFNQKIDFLPINLKELCIDTDYFLTDVGFNQSLDNLPNSIEYLTIKSHVFNQDIRIIPENIINISFRFKDNYKANKLGFKIPENMFADYNRLSSDKSFRLEINNYNQYFKKRPLETYINDLNTTLPIFPTLPIMNLPEVKQPEVIPDDVVEENKNKRFNTGIMERTKSLHIPFYKEEEEEDDEEEDSEPFSKFPAVIRQNSEHIPFYLDDANEKVRDPLLVLRNIFSNNEKGKEEE